jgi:hypothetical protein
VGGLVGNSLTHPPTAKFAQSKDQPRQIAFASYDTMVLECRACSRDEYDINANLDLLATVCMLMRDLRAGCYNPLGLLIPEIPKTC